MPLINLYPTTTQYKFNMVECNGVWQAATHEILGCTFHSRPKGWKQGEGFKYKQGSSSGKWHAHGSLDDEPKQPDAWPSFSSIEETDEHAQRIRDYVENDVRFAFDMKSIVDRYNKGKAPKY